MIMWKKEFIRTEAEDQLRRIAVLKDGNTRAGWSIVFSRHNLEWILPYEVGIKLPYNPRHLPVIQHRETSNEAYYLYLSIRRIIHGWRV